MSKHTQGRWRIGRYPEVIETAGKNDICLDMPNGGIYILAACNSNFMDDARANARRIVACVNACEGLPNEELEDGALPIVTDKLQRQRDELLEFAQEVRCTGDARLACLAMAVIAKATGSSDSPFHTDARSHAEPHSTP